MTEEKKPSSHVAPLLAALATVTAAAIGVLPSILHRDESAPVTQSPDIDELRSEILAAVLASSTQANESVTRPSFDLAPKDQRFVVALTDVMLSTSIRIQELEKKLGNPKPNMTLYGDRILLTWRFEQHAQFLAGYDVRVQMMRENSTRMEDVVWVYNYSLGSDMNRAISVTDFMEAVERAGFSIVMKEVRPDDTLEITCDYKYRSSEGKDVVIREIGRGVLPEARQTQYSEDI